MLNADKVLKVSFYEKENNAEIKHIVYSSVRNNITLQCATKTPHKYSNTAPKCSIDITNYTYDSRYLVYEISIREYTI